MIAFLFVFACRAVILIYDCQYQDFWPLLTNVVPLLSVLVVVRVANRLISNGNILREDDRRQEIVRTTHHLIAITKDLLARVGYAKLIIAEGGRPTIALVQIVKSIEDRYETLLQRDGYKYLPGPCVDIITCISGDVFGIAVLAEGINKQAASDKPALAVMPIPASDNGHPSPRFDDLMKNLQKLLDHLFELRLSVEVTKEKQ